MGEYKAIVAATSNATAGTDETWIEIFPPSNVAIELKRLRIGNLDIAVADQWIWVRIYRTTTAGATGVSFTPVKMRPQAPNSVCTCTVKNTTNAFTVGTIAAGGIMDRTVFNSRGIYDFTARDADDFRVSGINQRLAIVIAVNVVSHDLTVEATWAE
jgi:hypothetical protein